LSRSPAVAHAILFGGVAVVSTASILIRYAQAEGASSLLIAAGRLSIAALALAPIALRSAAAELARLPWRDRLLCAGSGLLLALHFWTWIASLEYTSVASSTALVTTNPLWVAVASGLLLRERPGAGTLAGIGLTLAGSAFIFASDASSAVSGTSPTTGNLLALAGAIAVSGYLLAGRALRARVALLTYVFTAYAVAAAALTLGCVAAHVPPHATTTAWALILALGVGPQLLGHTALNWALRRVSATFVAVSILGEPIGAAALAWLLLGERFAPLQFAGFALLLSGIYLAARAERPAA